jgi:hypothetical protein
METPFKRRLRRLGRVLLLVVSVLGIPAFVLASVVLSSSSRPRPFNGWAMVIASTGATQVALELEADYPGGYHGDHPEVMYRVGSCGPRPFRGALLLGGDARLSGADAGTSTTDGTVIPRPRAGDDQIKSVRRLAMGDETTEPFAELRHLQIVTFSLPAYSCRDLFGADDGDDNVSSGGNDMWMHGRLLGRVARTPSSPLGRWPTTETQAWPLLGAPIGTDIDLYDALHFDDEIRGYWSVPVPLRVRVNAGELANNENIAYARPAVAPTGTSLAWVEKSHFQATARVTNLDNEARWQSVQVACAIWFGLGGSILATVAYEAVRTRSDRGREVTNHEARAASSTESVCPGSGGRLLTVIAIFGMAISIWRRHRRP